MDGLFSYGVGVGPAIVLLAFVATGFFHNLQKKRRPARYDEQYQRINDWRS